MTAVGMYEDVKSVVENKNLRFCKLKLFLVSAMLFGCLGYAV